MTDLLHELFVQVLMDPRVQELRRKERAELAAEVVARLAVPTGGDSAAEPPPERLRTSEQMARVLGMSRSSFLRVVRSSPDLRSLKISGRWPESTIRARFGRLPR